MCSIEISRQTAPEWRLIICANRDEMMDRKPLRPSSCWVTKILLLHFFRLSFVKNLLKFWTYQKDIVG